IHLLVERSAEGVEVKRLGQQPWQFLAKLSAGESIEAAIESAGDFDCASSLAEHLALGRFCRFELAPCAAQSMPSTAT
ncbi:MAG TPA: hypothetical protein VK148_05750, partial [Xanthobacteraceae bacterium]|nr:hypothetical protein [Xanthobacteraceae bacterium]